MPTYLDLERRFGLLTKYSVEELLVIDSKLHFRAAAPFSAALIARMNACVSSCAPSPLAPKSRTFTTTDGVGIPLSPQ